MAEADLLRRRSGAAPDAAPSRRQRLGSSRWLGRAMVLPALILTIAISLYPLARGFMTSLQAGGPITGVPEHYAGLQNYRDVLSDPETRTAALHTLQYLVVAVGLELSAGLAIAVTLHRAFKGRGLILAVLVLPWALPSVVSGVLWRRILDPDSGLLNSALLRLGVIDTPHVWLSNDLSAIFFISLVHVWGMVPLISLVLIAGLQSIPEDVYAASSVDGAGPVQQFLHITLPLLRPAVVIAFTVGALSAISMFDEIYVLNGTALNTRSLVMEVYTTTFKEADFQHGIALALLIAAVSAIVAVTFGALARRAGST